MAGCGGGVGRTPVLPLRKTATEGSVRNLGFLKNLCSKDFAPPKFDLVMRYKIFIRIHYYNKFPEKQPRCRTRNVLPIKKGDLTGGMFYKK